MLFCVFLKHEMFQRRSETSWAEQLPQNNCDGVFFPRKRLLNFNTGIMEGGTGDRTTREVNLDRLRPRGVKRRLTTENDASTKAVKRVRRKRQKGQLPEEEEEEEEDEVDEDGREEMERLVGLVPSLMGREGSVSQVRPGILAK